MSVMKAHPFSDLHAKQGDWLRISVRGPLWTIGRKGGLSLRETKTSMNNSAISGKVVEAIEPYPPKVGTLTTVTICGRFDEMISYSGAGMIVMEGPEGMSPSALSWAMVVAAERIDEAEARASWDVAGKARLTRPRRAAPVKA